LIARSIRVSIPTLWATTSPPHVRALVDTGASVPEAPRSLVTCSPTVPPGEGCVATTRVGPTTRGGPTMRNGRTSGPNP
jgi:hypothetical protein